MTTQTVPIEPTDEMIRVMLAVDNPATYREHLYHPDDGASSKAETESRVHRARRKWSAMLAAAPAPSSLAGGEVSRAVACVGQVANGAQVAEVYGGEWCLDPALEFRAHLRAILAALSPEAPAREGSRIAELEFELSAKTHTLAIADEQIERLEARIKALTPRHEAPAEKAEYVDAIGALSERTPEAPAEGAGEREEIARLRIIATPPGRGLYDVYGLSASRHIADLQALLSEYDALRAYSSAPESRSGEGQ